MGKWRHDGGGRFDVYSKQKTDWGSILGGIFIVFLILAVLANI